MKKEQILIIVTVIAVILFAGNVISFGKINKLNGEAAQLNKMVQQKDASIKSLTDKVQAKQQEADGIRKELDAAKQKLAAVESEVGTIKKDLDNAGKKVAAAPKPAPAPVAPKAPKK